MNTDDEMLEAYDRMEGLSYDCSKRSKMILLARLTVPELRLLLVHYKYAIDAKDAKTWSKRDAVEMLAEHMVDEEGY